MLPNGRRLGAHLPLGDGMVRAADRAAEIGASTIQVFTDNPVSWRRRHLPPRELPAFRARLAELDIAPIAIHAPYLINLASPDPDFFERSVQVLAN
jgi:deoxyribonuclease-4